MLFAQFCSSSIFCSLIYIYHSSPFYVGNGKYFVLLLHIYIIKYSTELSVRRVHRIDFNSFSNPSIVLSHQIFIDKWHIKVTLITSCRLFFWIHELNSISCRANSEKIRKKWCNEEITGKKLYCSIWAVLKINLAFAQWLFTPFFV